MDFCKNCDNFLYIKEDPEQRKIFNYCKSCDFEKEATDNCVFRKKYKKNESAPFINHKYINNDPTYPTKKVKCPKCKKVNTCAYYQCHNLSIVMVCSKCYHNWQYFQ